MLAASIRPVVVSPAHAIEEFDPIKVNSGCGKVKHIAMAKHQQLTSLRIAARLRSSGRSPPFQAFLAALAFPSTLRGPVACSHGRQFWIACACRRRRSGVQPLRI